MGTTPNVGAVTVQLSMLGIVVDDKEAVRAAARTAGIDVSPPPALDIRDPWGNLLQVVDYREIQFSKTPEVLAAMGHAGLRKREAALTELRDHLRSLESRD